MSKIKSEAQGTVKNYPLLLIPETVLFPENIIPLSSLKGMRKKDLSKIKSGSLRFGVLARLKNNETEESDHKHFVAGFGTEAVVTALIKLPNGDVGAMIKGGRRFMLHSITKEKSTFSGEVTFIQDKSQSKTPLFLAEIKAFKSLLVKFLRLQPSLSQEALAQVFTSKDPYILSFLVSPHLSFTLDQQISLLGKLNLRRRLNIIVKALGKEIELLQISNGIQDKVQSNVQESMKRGFLREQMQIIKNELGNLGADEGDELSLLKKSLSKMDLPAKVKEASEKELSRLEIMGPSSPEYMVSWNYLNWIKDLPWADFQSKNWKESNKINVNLSDTAKILDKYHYGLDKIKERILEYVAVLSHKGKATGQILLLSGPPGVGKTSLGKSIAEALDRPFARVSLGGVKDEAEIRGHRRTYIGSMPGKIIQAIKEAKSPRPVILLDEIDKAGKDGMADISAALLEVLDPEQNTQFTDHYLGLPFDLSQVLFIATANNSRELLAPLLDRMEAIELSGYTEKEKIYIAKDHLFPAISKNYSLEKHTDLLTEDTLKLIIRYYTRESGVRQLNRLLNKIGRKIVKKIVTQKDAEQIDVNKSNLLQYLGNPPYLPEPREQKLSPGVSIGLAYTTVGGEILYIESRKNKTKSGNRNLILTGSLGKVMQESAQAVFSFLLSFSERLGISREEVESSSVHIHLPDGATPKDGPSAGCALLCALTSLFLGKSMPGTMAMTGEITLRGQVLPVGGIKDKLLAAHRYGKTDIILPAANWLDLEDIPEEILSDFNLYPVKTMMEVLQIAGLINKNADEPACLAQQFKKGFLEKEFPFENNQLHSPWLQH